MPRLTLQAPQGPTAEQFLYDEGPPALLQGLHYVGEGLALPQRGVLSALTGFQKDIRGGFDELMDYYGVPEGPELSEAEARIGKAAVWGLAGAAVTAPFTGGLSLLGGLIFAGLSQIGTPKKHLRGVLGGAGEIATDPLMYLRLGRHGTRLTNQFLGHYWTKKGSKLVQKRVKEMFPALEHMGTGKALEAAHRQAERAIIGAPGTAEETAKVTSRAIKKGLLHPGGVRLEIPAIGGFGFVRQGTLDKIGKGFAKHFVPEPVKRAAGYYGKEAGDVIKTQEHGTRMVAAAGRQYTKKLGQILRKQKIPTEYGNKVHEVVQLTPVFGFDDALRRVMPDLPAKHLRGVKRSVAAVRNHFKRAQSLARKHGLDIDQVDDQILRDLARRQVTLAALKQKYIKQISRPTEKLLKQIDDKIAELVAKRTAEAKLTEGAIDEVIGPLMKSIFEIERRGHAQGLRRVQIDQQIKDFITQNLDDITQNLQRQHGTVSAKVAGWDSAISKLHGAREGLGEELAARIAGMDSADDAIAKLSDEVRALKAEGKRRIGYFPRGYSDDFRWWAGWLSRNPDRYSEVIDKLPKRFPGMEKIITGEGVVTEIPRADIARAMLDDMISAITPGGWKPPVPRSKSAHQLERGLAVEVKATKRGTVERIRAELGELGGVLAPVKERRALRKELRKLQAAEDKEIRAVHRRFKGTTPASMERRAKEYAKIRPKYQSDKVALRRQIEAVQAEILGPPATVKAMLRREKELQAQLTDIRKLPEEWGTGVWRSLRPDELKAVSEGLGHMMGEKLPRMKLRRLLSGKDSFQNYLKHNPPEVFETNPITGLTKYYERLGKPLGIQMALDDAINRFGKTLKEFTEPLVGGGPPAGWMVLDDIPQFAGKAAGRMPAREAVALPVDVAYGMRRWWRNVNNVETYRRFLAPYVWLSQYWKQIALAFPAFHGRNAQSGVWLSAVTGSMQNPMSLVHAFRALFARGDFGLWGRNGSMAAERVRLSKKGFTSPWSGKRYSYREVLDIDKQFGVEGPGFWTFENRMGANQPGPRAITGIDRFLFQLNARIGEGVENWLRHGQMIDLLWHGWSPREAAIEVARTHFLYETLTPFFQGLRNYGFPFVAWSRFVIPRTAQSMLKNPAPYLLFDKLIDDIEDESQMPAHAALIPDWIRRQMGIHIGRTEDGEDMYGLLGNMWPASDLIQLMGDPVGEIVSQLNPILRGGIEQYFGQETWTGRKIARFEGEQVPVTVPFLGVTAPDGAAHALLGFPKEIHVPAEFAPLMRAIRLANEYDRRIGPLARGDVDDPVGYGRQQMLHAMLGWKVYVVDRSQVARATVYRNESEYRRRKGLYFRAMHQEDTANAEAHLRWFASHGFGAPSETEVLESWKRRQKEAQRMQQRLGAVEGLR
jgi:hypothetical protein